MEELLEVGVAFLDFGERLPPGIKKLLQGIRQEGREHPGIVLAESFLNEVMGDLESFLALL